LPRAPPPRGGPAPGAQQDEQPLEPLPEEDRALQRAPEARDAVAQRARRHARVGDVPPAEAARDEEVLGAPDGEGSQDERAARRPPRGREPSRSGDPARARARDRAP